MLKLFVAIQSKLAEVRSEEGQTMAEYGVVLAVITLVIVGDAAGALRCHQRRPRGGHRSPLGPVGTRRHVRKNARTKVVTMSKETIQTKAESGQTMAEYAVVLGVITLAIVATFALLSGAINESFEKAIEVVSAAF